jgi:hypothetical protein
MKEFLAPKGGLAALQPSTRLALALFLVFALLGYGVMIALGVARSGLDVTSIRDYYGGSTPELAKSTGELLELTHFHLFAMPMQLFVLGHVFLLGRYSQRWRRWIVVAAFAGAACDLAAPRRLGQARRPAAAGAQPDADDPCSPARTAATQLRPRACHSSAGTGRRSHRLIVKSARPCERERRSVA